ncbi:MAG: anti-sigma factor family protein [Pyrinomonadaceae bacterium]
MNCEHYQNLLSDFIDGSLTPQSQTEVESHLGVCAPCAEARVELDAIVGFYREHRGEYDPVPNERALWVRISNTIESELAVRTAAAVPAGAGWWFRLTNRSWNLSFPQLATTVAATIVFAVLVTFVGMRAFNPSGIKSSGLALATDTTTVKDRYRQQQQVIDYWNQRVEMNKARWSAQMRGTFEQNISVYDATVNESMSRLSQNPHDEVSEDILNAAMSDKIALLKAFAEL